MVLHLTIILGLTIEDEAIEKHLYEIDVALDSLQGQTEPQETTDATQQPGIEYSLLETWSGPDDLKSMLSLFQFSK